MSDIARVRRIWRGMRQRCRNPNEPAYKHYGGRGIYFDAVWDDFETFKEWSLSNGYADDLQIDRIDNDGPYAPTNCRWTTAIVNMNNRRSNRVLTVDGERLTVSEAARKYARERNARPAPEDLSRGV